MIYLDNMKHKKYLSSELLINNILFLRKKKLIIGFTNGCFDLLHKGHLQLLFKSKQKCDYLIIGLNSDNSIKLLKGNDRPIDDQLKRVHNLSKLDIVDAIIIFDELHPLNLIEKIKPDILFKGGDYSKKEIIGSDYIENYGGKVEIIEILSGYSTTNIINNSLNK